jgi:hypothetical protein
MESVSSLMEMSVGVTDAAGGRVTGTSVGVAIGEMGVKVGGTGVEVDKTSTEKLQASSNNALNRKIIIDRNPLGRFIRSLFPLLVG